MIDEFQKRQEVIMTVRSKTSPFSMNEMVEEFKAQEALNHLSNETMDTLDGQGVQEDLDALDESLEELQRPDIDFSIWQDNVTINEYNS